MYFVQFNNPSTKTSVHLIIQIGMSWTRPFRHDLIPCPRRSFYSHNWTILLKCSFHALLCLQKPQLGMPAVIPLEHLQLSVRLLLPTQTPANARWLKVLGPVIPTQKALIECRTPDLCPSHGRHQEGTNRW